MAGAGYKLFATGDVLTAAEVNTYLQQQVTMVFANSTARTTALSGVLAEGMMSYLQDTNTVEVYNGSNWVNVGNTGDVTEVQAGTGISVADGTGPIPIVTNTMATEIDAKGDLIVGTGSDAFDRLGVGNDGESIVADSSTTTGLAYREDYAAGKNKILNGDFRINQRSFSTTTTTATYGFDRWSMIASDGTTTYSAQTFTAGTAPVAGYEAINFARLVSSGQTAAGAFSILQQKIEDVRTFAGQTVTVSFWAKASTGTPNIAVNLLQDFGSGGSTGVYNFPSSKKFAITASWARYTLTIPVASISGKTIGTGSSLTLYFWTSAGTTFNTQTDSMGIQSITVDFWGAQVEDGSVATAFQTATGTLAGELAACQRYYWRLAGGAAANYAAVVGVGYTLSANTCNYTMMVPVPMRTAAISIDYADMGVQDQNDTTITNLDSITLSTHSSNYGTSITITKTGGFTDDRVIRLVRGNNAAGYIGVSAEL